MSKYRIIHTSDATEYREQIKQFMQDYLHDTPINRFEWLADGNPAGKTIWFLAILEKTGELIGTVSLLPKDIFSGGSRFQGGILGDLMVHQSYRVFGPALSLIKGAVSYGRERGLKIIYTIPNPDSLKLTQRAGFKLLVDVSSFVRPIRSHYFFKKYLPDYLTRLICPLVDISLRLISKETYTRQNYFVEELFSIDDSNNSFWEKVQKTKSKLIGDHSASYINWRYFQNPQFSFRIFTFSSKDRERLGYFILTIENNKLSVYDILTNSDENLDTLLNAIIRVGRKEKCNAIYFTVPNKEKWINILKPYRFFDSKGSMQVYSIYDSNIPFAEWNFFQGDRNI